MGPSHWAGEAGGGAGGVAWIPHAVSHLQAFVLHPRGLECLPSPFSTPHPRTQPPPGPSQPSPSGPSSSGSLGCAPGMPTTPRSILSFSQTPAAPAKWAALSAWGGALAAIQQQMHPQAVASDPFRHSANTSRAGNSRRRWEEGRGQRSRTGSLGGSTGRDGNSHSGGAEALTCPVGMERKEGSRRGEGGGDADKVIGRASRRR